MDTQIQIKGVRFKYKNNIAVCYIDCLSDELKKIIKARLTTICHGSAKVNEYPKAYNYDMTLKSFMKRYEKKHENTQKGMIGELLFHILALELFTEFETVSPYFNMEENSIRKGFDVLLYDSEKSEIWITEVKAGEQHQNKCSDDTTKDFLNTAYTDLKKRLNEQNINYWDQAITSVKSAVNDNRDDKKIIENILAGELTSISEGTANGQDNNVIVVSVLFETLTNPFTESTPQTFLNKRLKEENFKKLIAVSVQKETYKKVIDFFEAELK